MTQANCFCCKKVIEMKDAKESKTKRGITIAKGKCPTCGKGVARIIGKKK